MRPTNRGFTLIELFVAIAIVGIVVLIIFLNTGGHQPRPAGAVRAEPSAECRGIYDHAEYVTRTVKCIYTIVHLADGRTRVINDCEPVVMTASRGSSIRVTCPRTKPA